MKTKALKPIAQHQLPIEIPMPKFMIGQRVKACGNHFGVITGMEYVTLFTAIAAELESDGWEYTVDFYFGAPLREARTHPESVEKFDEDELELAEEAP